MKLDLRNNNVFFGDNLEIMKKMPDGCVNLIYIDPPFNTGDDQKMTSLEMTQNDLAGRTGFQGKKYATRVKSIMQYSDRFEDYEAFLRPRLEEAYRLLAIDGCLYFHIDYREVHYCKVWLDKIFGRENFLNEIIWAYDYGGKAKTRWPTKHDNILYYVKDHRHYTFNVEEIDRIPYMAPGLAGAEKAAKGKLPTDTWWMTIVPTNGPERTGYPNQKPLKLLQRIINTSSNPDDLVLDFFAGSGTTGEAAASLGRRFFLIDQNPASLKVIKERFETKGISFISSSYKKEGGKLVQPPIS